MANYRYYLGPWVWDDNPVDPSWIAPSSTVGLIDLRGLPAQSLAGSLGDRPYGFFACTSELDSDYQLLGQGDLRELQPDSLVRSAWESLLGSTPEGATLNDFLFSQLTTNSDVTGETPTPPLMPTNGALEVHLAGHSIVKSERFWWGHKHTNKVKAVLQKDFEKLFNDAQEGKLKDREHHRRVLDYWCEQYKVSNWTDFVPPKLRQHVPGRLKHETTISDNFNRADAAPISTGSFAWTQINSTSQIKNNHASGVTSAGASAEVRADSDLSSSDHYAQAELLAGGATNTFCGVGCRKDSTSTRTFYLTSLSSTSLTLRKRVSGTATTLRTDSPSISLPDTMKCQASGSTIEHFWNGVSQGTSTDTAITSGTRCLVIPGFDGGDANQLDDFTAADLSANTYSETGSGGSLGGSSADVSVYYSVTASAGGSLGSTADVTAYYSETGSAGGSLGSTADCSASYSVVASAGAVAGSQADVFSILYETGAAGSLVGGNGLDTQVMAESGLGGALGGSGAVLGSQFDESMSGGSLVGSQADVLGIFAELPTGGLTSSGAADFALIMIESPTGGAVAGSFADVGLVLILSTTGGAVAGGSAVLESAVLLKLSGALTVCPVYRGSLSIIDVYSADLRVSKTFSGELTVN